VGLKASWNDHTTLQAAFFAHWIDDTIGLRPIGPDRFWDNLGDVTLYGFEATGAWRPCPWTCEGLELFGSTGITWTSDEDVVPETPIHGRLGARLSTCREGCGWRRWFVEGSVRGSADSELGDGTGGDPFVTADVLAGVGWTTGGRRNFWATIGATNLFDADYTEPFCRLPAAGVSVIASLSVEF
jgi:outer membrane receptor protein involved in Fe transport